MNQYLSYFLVGLAVLAIALILNIGVKFIGLDTWYDYIFSIGETGFWNATKTQGFNLIFLYLIYPFILGMIAVLTKARL